MSKSVLVEVSSKSGRPTAEKHVQNLLKEAGLSGSRCQKVAALYRLEGGFKAGEVQKIAEELLADPVSEAYAVDSLPADGKTIFLDIWCKPGVTDPAAESVLKAIRDLNIESVEKAHSGTRYALLSTKANGDFARKAAEFAAKELLNPLIQECKIQRAPS